MKMRRPVVKPEQLKEFFLREDAGARRDRSKLRRNSAAALWYLDKGIVRAWDPKTGEVNVWVKRAILTYFSAQGAEAFGAGCFEYHDKLRVKRRVSMKNVRAVPGSVIRYGSFVDSGAIIMPGFVNVGAWVGKGTMVDTWATVGSCAQIGDNVHLAGGVGIGGVLEPEQAMPVVIGDGAFVGSRAVIVEGVSVGREAVIGAGVVLTASTRIIDVRDVRGSSPVVSKGAIPERAVVIPGSYPKAFPAGEFGVPCALIIGERTASTDLKTSLNQALRKFEVAV